MINRKRISLAAAVLAALTMTLPGPAAASVMGGDDLPGSAFDSVDPRPPGAGARVSGPLTRADVPYSYRPGCPVAPQQLRRITLHYTDFDGRKRLGQLIARKEAVADLVHVFTKAHRAGFPIARMTPVDAFYRGGTVSPSHSDLRAMRANNTSAFNCRPVTGNPYRLSTHAVGIAIDVNPVHNPYVTSSRVYPEGSKRFLNRANFRDGMIVKGGVLARAFAARGWKWGARWSRPDYQHFSSNGG